MRFIAIDFEFVNNKGEQKDACSLGIAKFNDKGLHSCEYFLINPDTDLWMYYCCNKHKIKKSDVAGEPRFPDRYEKIRVLMKKADFIVCHSIGADRGVIEKCCRKYDIEMEQWEWKDTQKLVKNLKKSGIISGTSLEIACKHFNISMGSHHNAADDAISCGKLYMELMEYFKEIG